VINQTKHCD